MISKTKQYQRLSLAAKKRNWSNKGAQDAKRLGYQPEKANYIFQLGMILHKLGGFLLPVPSIQRLLTDTKRLNVIGPGEFILCTNQDDTFISHEYQIATALYFYIHVSEYGKKPLATDNVFYDEKAEEYAAGFLVPIKAFEREILEGERLTQMKNLTESLSRHWNIPLDLVENRCESLGLMKPS